MIHDRSNKKVLFAADDSRVPEEINKGECANPIVLPNNYVFY